MEIPILVQEILPEQHSGKQVNTETYKRFASVDEAKAHYMKVRMRLLNVNHWQQYAGPATASFQLIDANGSEVSRQVQQGDYFRINIPGPGLRSGHGQDWVQVQIINQRVASNMMLSYFTVRAAAHPLSTTSEPAHFFDRSSTSTFVAGLDGCNVFAGVYGRNEQPNAHTANLIDHIRNIIIATGALLGFSKLQWKALTNGLIKSSETSLVHD